MSIEENFRRLREEVPEHVTITLAVKTRAADEVRQAIEAGATDIGENYVQQAETLHAALGGDAGRVRWHLIGHLQRNKANKALALFDVIQTVDSVRLAAALSRRAANGVPVYIEVNSAREAQKTGVFPENAEALIRDISALGNVHVQGLMTMGPDSDDPERVRPCFRETRALFERLRSLDLPNVDMRVLSMGMSNSYRVAIEEGSNMIRPGRVVFGERCVE